MSKQGLPPGDHAGCQSYLHGHQTSVPSQGCAIVPDARQWSPGDVTGGETLRAPSENESCELGTQSVRVSGYSQRARWHVTVSCARTSAGDRGRLAALVVGNGLMKTFRSCAELFHKWCKPGVAEALKTRTGRETHEPRKANKALWLSCVAIRDAVSSAIP